MQWKSYFTFSKSERIGLMFFLIIMGIFLSSPYWIGHITSNKNRNSSIEFQLLQIDKDSSTKFVISNPSSAPALEGRAAMVLPLRPFNPNTLQEADWIAMGISAKTARTLQRYINKGGRFRSANDLYKIWGMRESDIKRLLPYVQIESSTAGIEHGKQTHSNTFTPTQKIIHPIEINQADSADWESLPGIGPVLAKRIIRFRTLSRGFQFVEAIKGVYGLSDTVFNNIKPYLRISTTRIVPIKKLDINQATVSELQRISLISREVAQAIVLYRQQYGRFESMSDLRKLVLITDSLMNKLEQTVEVGSVN